MFNKLVEEKSSEFRNLERRSNPDDLIQKHKTGKNSERFQKLSKSYRVIQRFKRWQYKPKRSIKRSN